MGGVTGGGGVERDGRADGLEKQARGPDRGPAAVADGLGKRRRRSLWESGGAGNRTPWKSALTLSAQEGEPDPVEPLNR